MYKIGNSCGKINRIWDKSSNRTMDVAVSSARVVFNLMGTDAFVILKCRDEAESKLKDIKEHIENIKASPSSVNISISINLNINDIPFNLFKLLKFNRFPKNINDLIDNKQELEKYIALCSFYLYAFKNLNESLERFDDEEKIRIIGALLQFRDNIGPYTRSIDGCQFFKHDAEKWGFIGKEADFYSHNDRVSCFRDDIGEKFRRVKIDDKHAFYFDDFDKYLSRYIDEFKKAYQKFDNTFSHDLKDYE